jgi:4-amino-4-deoxy-L-arabinose transferase-like glycosyltransferase
VKIFNKFNLLLSLLLLASFFIRIYKINSLTLFGDELDVGYQAYSLLHTGKDYKGNFFPTYLQSIAESRAPLLIYLTVPSVKIFGLNELGVRFVPILFGVLSILTLVFLVRLLTNNESLALLSGMALSFNPWHIHYSRTAFEVTLLIFLILTGIYLFFNFLKSGKNIFAYLSLISFALSFYAYNTANIFVPLLAIFLVIANLKNLQSKLNIKNISIGATITFILVLPMIKNILFGSAANRFNLISIFNDKNTIDSIINKRTSFSAASPSIEKLFHNKPIAWTQTFLHNYVNSISPSFLFLNGDPRPRHSITGFGLLFLSFLPFLFIGIFNTKIKDSVSKLMLFWLLIAPISSSLTIGGGDHATRMFLLLPPIAYFIGYGIYFLIKNKNVFSKLFLIIFSVALIFESTLFIHEYFVHYPKDSFENWAYGYKELFQNIPNTSTKLFISNAYYSSIMPYMFYQKYNPTLLSDYPINDNEKPNIYKNLSGYQLNPNTYFINNWNSQGDTIKLISDMAEKNDVFVLFQQKDIPGDWDLSKNPIPSFKTISTVYNPNNTIFGQILQKQ